MQRRYFFGPIEKQQAIYSKSNMQTFSLGVPKRESKRQKKERMKKEKERKEKEKRQKKLKKPQVPLKKQPLWRLLPLSLCDGLAFWIDTLSGKTYIEKKESLLKQINLWKQPLSSPFSFPPSLHSFDFLEKTQQLELMLQRNQDLRWQFKRFLNRIRVRKMKKANEVDPFTLETFKQPIHLVSFSNRVIYTFEAESFMKHVTKRLLNNDGHIAQPLFPQNPLTNQSFSLAQTIGLLQQSRLFGYSSWPIEAFSSCKYSLPRFVAIHSKPLRLHALHATMTKYDDWEFVDTLFDFIKSQHLYHKKTFEQLVYKLAIVHTPEHECIKKWKRLCIKWYEIDILMEDESVRDVEYEKLEKLTEALCEYPKELIQHRKTNSLEKSRANGSSSY